MTFFEQTPYNLLAYLQHFMENEVFKNRIAKDLYDKSIEFINLVLAKGHTLHSWTSFKNEGLYEEYPLQ